MRLGIATLLLVLAAPGAALAAMSMAGDATTDGQFQSDDVVTIVNLDGASPDAGVTEIHADADRDNDIDTDDADRVAEIIVGLAEPNPLTDPETAVSYMTLSGDGFSGTASIVAPLAVGAYSLLDPEQSLVDVAEVSFLNVMTSDLGLAPPPLALSVFSLAEAPPGLYAEVAVYSLVDITDSTIDPTDVSLDRQ